MSCNWLLGFIVLYSGMTALVAEESARFKSANAEIEKNPGSAASWFKRGQLYAEAGSHGKAVEDFSKGLELDPRSIAAWQARGVEYFRLGEFQKSIADFDKFIELRPEQEPYHWQRGIAYYYAGQYGKGRRQFEIHQTVNPNDVENAVWHFLCVAREKDLEEARQKLISISGDTRVPMKEVHALFAGKATIPEVIKAAEETSQKDPLFYAHLYLGLFEEARGNQKESLIHMRKAVEDYGQNHYMGDVARVHLKARADQAKSPK